MSSEPGRLTLFNRLADGYGADLYRFALWLCGDPTLAEDLVQETFLRAWKGLGALKEPAAAKGWLITILRREYARTFERKVPRFADIESVDVEDGGEPEPDDRTEIAMLRENILKLAPKYREPLLLQVVLGYSCDEIAEALGSGRNAVLTQLFRAREQLKSRLQRDGLTGNVHGLF